jgi:hypothetical protein
MYNHHLGILTPYNCYRFGVTVPFPSPDFLLARPGPRALFL